MKHYFSSDYHIHHKNILKFCPESRAAASGSVILMNELILQGLRDTVTEDDVLYILGDVAFANSHHHIAAFLDNIPKVKELHLIKGNHDQMIMRNDYLQDYFDTVSSYKEIKLDGVLVCMMHYPIESWKEKSFGSIHLHGHWHSNNDPLNIASHHKGHTFIPNRMDVGIDSRIDFKPWEWAEIQQFLQQHQPKEGIKE